VLAASAYGKMSFSVTLKDAGGLESGRESVASDRVLTFTIDVQGINDAPSFQFEMPTVTVPEDSGSYVGRVIRMSTLRAESSGSIFNETTQTLSFSLFPDRDVFTTDGQPNISAVDGKLKFTLAPDQHGVVSIRVVLRDNGGTQDGGSDSTEAYLTLNITGVNDPPSFQMSRLNFFQDENAGQVSMPAIARKISAGILEDCVGWDPTCVQQLVSFVVDDVSAVDLFTTLPSVSPYGTMSFTLAPHETGTARVIIHLEDEDAAISETRELFITVVPVNDRPDFRLPWNVKCDNIGAMDACTCPSSDNRSHPLCEAITPGVCMCVYARTWVCRYTSTRVIYGNRIIMLLPSYNFNHASIPPFGSLIQMDVYVQT
jgi:hypothetical protein